MKRAVLVAIVSLVLAAVGLLLRDRVNRDRAAAASASAAWSSLLQTDDRAHLPVLDEEASDAGPSETSPRSP